MRININEPKKDKSADTIHIDDYDVWSLDYTLARIIHPALVRLKEKKNGYPELLEDGMVTPQHWDRQLHFDFIDEEVEEKYLIDKWNGILDKMIYSFGKIMEDEYFDNVEWKKIQEGLDLFGKHYTSLWD